jgi:hypothetical protein
MNSSEQQAIPLDLVPGEAFVRIAIDEETGQTQFTCGLYPSNKTIEKDFDLETDIDPDMLLGVCIAGIAEMLMSDSDELIRAGMNYISSGDKVFDVIVDTEDQEYYQNLTEEQRRLMKMAVQGEA